MARGLAATLCRVASRRGADDPGTAEPIGGDAQNTPDAEGSLPEQEDERWEQALPLNGTNVGDRVVPALPINRPVATFDASGAGAPSSTLFDSGRRRDGLNPSA